MLETNHNKNNGKASSSQEAQQPGTLPWRSTCGRSEGASQSHSRAKRAPRNTQDIKYDANLCNKKGNNMTAKVMPQKRPGNTPSKHGKMCCRPHRSTICTCCIAQENTRRIMLFCAKMQCQKTTKLKEKTYGKQKMLDWVPRARQRPRA